ncbi:hypothetical protein PHYSODRAFT_448534, partial [Phytophthora sojae]
SFIRRYAFNMNKVVKREKGGSLHTKWRSSGHEGGCSWLIALNRKRESKISAGTSKTKRKKPKSKFSHVPDGAWYISKIADGHAQFCSSSARITSEFLEEQPGFRAAIVKGHSTSLPRVVNNMSFLQEFAKANAGSHVCCQLDDKGRFFRAFLSIGSVVSIQDALLPVWECDGTHMKGPMYNGIFAVAYVHKETVGNFAWFLANCIVAGLNLQDRPTFCDRGKQLGAQVVLAKVGLKVHLKFCSVHIRFNVMDTFKSLKLNMQSVKNDILALQDASTTAGFDHVASSIEGRYPTGISKIVADQLVEEQVFRYLRSIHPTDWCVVGYMQPTAEEKKWLADSWDPFSSHGDPLTLFGVRTTSAAEGENNGLLWKGVRNKLVLGSMMTYCARAIEVVQKRKV